MRSPFKSKYYFAIIDTIATKENEKEDVKNWQETHTKGNRAWNYYQFKSGRLQEEIDLLRKLLHTKNDT